MDSDDDSYYHEYDEDESEHSEEDDDDYGYSAGDYEGEVEVKFPQKNYTILAEDTILQRQKQAIQDVSSVLSISESDAAMLLHHFKWSVSLVEDEWFQDEEGVRKKVGLLSPQEDSDSTIEEGDELRCGICFDNFSFDEMSAPHCDKHLFCMTCWEGYISNAVNEGPGCLTLRCPDPSCEAAIGEDLIQSVVNEECLKKLRRYKVRSYVEDRKMAKWCPAPGCEYAVEYVAGSGSYDIICNCNHLFCWNCLEEGHRPVHCDTVEKWILKNSAESENMNWILAHSKPCPKCKRPIEKNQGCMHMVCTPPCKHEFCWLCLGNWTEHGEKTGGFYSCNRYESAKNDGAFSEAERRRDMAKNSLERYTHYYERWASNEQSRVKAQQALKDMQNRRLEILSTKQGQPASQLKFVVEALSQIVECRRVLKWTYAYGYYLPASDKARREFFEYLQGEAESALERLHNCAEKELEEFYSSYSLPTFSAFRAKLAGLTSVTHSYFNNLVNALENGLADVDATGTIKHVAAAAAAVAATNAVAESSSTSSAVDAVPYFSTPSRPRTRKQARAAAAAITSTHGRPGSSNH